MRNFHRALGLTMYLTITLMMGKASPAWQVSIGGGSGGCEEFILVDSRNTSLFTVGVVGEEVGRDIEFLLF